MAFMRQLEMGPQLPVTQEELMLTAPGGLMVLKSPCFSVSKMEIFTNKLLKHGRVALEPQGAEAVVVGDHRVDHPRAGHLGKWAGGTWGALHCSDY